MSNLPTKVPLRHIPVSMPFPMVDAVEKFAKDEGISRSEAVRRFTVKGLAEKKGADSVPGR